MADSCGHYESSHIGSRRAPELLGIMSVAPVTGKAGLFGFTLPHKTRGEFTLLLECQAKDFPFDKYCRFVRHPGQEYPYTFSSMEFHETPPGMRVGPWPGWRGIPEFPEVLASSGLMSVKLRPAFWGDETNYGTLRLFGRFSHAVDYVVTVAVSDPRIIPHRVSVYRTEALKARPHPTMLLPDLADSHPRLLIAAKVLPSLRARATGSHRQLWQHVAQLWENRELPFEKSPESKCLPGPERLSGEDRVLLSGLIALVTERREDVEQALRAYADYIDQTGRPDFEPLGIDTQAGEVLFILSVGYDWLSAWMSDSARKTAWERIEQVAGVCTSFLTPERTDYGQAHYLGCGLGLLAYSFLERGEHASTLRNELRGALDCALELLSEDGSYPHGINLWIYEFGFLLRWIELLRTCTDDDIWASRGRALSRASAFRAATLSADGRHGLTFGDPQYRVGGDSWCHFLIASRTGSGLAQWLGGRLADLPHEGVDFRSTPARRRVYEFLFFNPAVTPTAPGSGVRSYPEIGQVTVRSPRTYFAMRSGPPLGIRRYASGEYGAYGHSDPASGSFLLEHRGKLVASGPGPVYRRDTALHNVVTIDGKGQLGDSTVWLPDFIPPELLPPTLELYPDGSCAAVTADLTKSYLPYLGVERYRRSIYVDGERIVLGVDDVACRTEHSIEWNAHSRFPFRNLSAKGPTFFNVGGEVRMFLLSPLNVEWESGLSEFIPAYPNDGMRDYRCVIKVKSAAVRFIWCYLLDSRSSPELRNEMNGAFTIEMKEGHSFYFDGRRFLSRGKP